VLPEPAAAMPAAEPSSCTRELSESLREQMDADAAMAMALSDPLREQIDADAALARDMQAEEDELAGTTKRPSMAPPPLAPLTPSVQPPTPSVQPPAAPRQIAIDGMNVGRDINFRDEFYGPAQHQRATSPDKPVFALAIKIAIDHYLELGYDVAAFLPVWCMDGGRSNSLYAVRHELLQPYLDMGILVLTPSRMDDDNWIIDHAQKTERCAILTNDHYRREVEAGLIDAAWRDDRVVKFTFVQNELRPMPYAKKR